ncbi:MAG TPA: bifunctional UDP-3-O-[3-hydroxymyristoyl] N-acetylglucosamine deacetylase/3-hydroxyacyl-ACP dehydratase [Candidatus Omnitrophota bacterium]|nr:bifunctional UDP-3-O-[3-hydroxymyristoyl] N-acetylglucosamine deacetylase/3-hydroxyacyl-ACP dehydratase [Candidatus Omnitrophota bacterium]
MMHKQKTIKKGIVLQGRGLHTGNPVTVCLKPAEKDTGIIFRRVDLPGQPCLSPALENILVDNTVPRCTSLCKNDVVIHTVEHFMAALFGCGIDNLVIEIDNNELPGLDGSGKNFLEELRAVGMVEQDARREYIEVREPVSVYNNGSSILIVPADELKVSYALNYDHPLLRAQFFSSVVNPETFERDIAPSRTFCLEQEASELQANGLGRGANYKNTLVVGEAGVIQNAVRFPDEFARHKVLDLLGDLYLLGKPVKGHIFAMRSGHALNVELLKKIHRQHASVTAPPRDLSGYKADAPANMDIQAIMNILPHRYPFLLVDRVVELEIGKRAVGLKNVTINDNFFSGHFPTRPVMPGVLMIEAMAQVGGILMMTNEIHNGKVALFMATDKVKFRRLVNPGDQLRMEVDVLRDRSRTAVLKGVAKVDGEVAAEAEMTFSFLDAQFLYQAGL